MRFAFAIIGTAVISVSALAQSVTLTVKDGRPLVVGGQTELGIGLEPVNLEAPAIVAEFSRLCLPDPEGAAARSSSSPLGLTPSDAIFPPEGKTGSARVSQWSSRLAIMSVWSGDESGLKGRSIAMPSRGATTTGPYGPFKAFAAQCNLVVTVKDFAAAKAVTDSLNQKFGTAGKLVVKNTFADGFWQSGQARINVNIPITRNGPQPIHLSTQMIPSGAK